MNAVKIIKDFIQQMETEIENNESLQWIWDDYDSLGSAFMDGMKLDDEEIISFASADYKLLVKDAKEILYDRYGFAGAEDGEVHTLIYLPSVDVYIDFEGWYSSYEGTSFTNLKEVVPVQKTVTVYEPKN